MKNYVYIAFALFVALAMPATLAETGSVDVMKHVCNEDIQTQQDFDALGSFVNKVLACPTIITPGDDFTPGSVHGEKMEFRFSVLGNDHDLHTMDNAQFTQQALCETDIGMDVNGDGEVSEDTCLDTSLYSFTGVEMGHVHALETMTPENARYGALEFTPDAVVENMDAQTLLSEGHGVIELDTTKDDDKKVTLHVYNFVGNEMMDSGTSTESYRELPKAQIEIVRQEGRTVTFRCVAPFDADAYDWNFGDGTQFIDIEDQEISHTYAAGGHYEITCTPARGLDVAQGYERKATEEGMNNTNSSDMGNNTNSTQMMSSVRVMTHICDESIESREDFEALGSFVDKVLTCPTIILNDDMFTSGSVHADNMYFNYEVHDQMNVHALANAEFMQQAICETDLGMDVNGDGEVSEDTCLDTSLYAFTNLESGEIRVEQVDSPSSTHFGDIEFTPDAIVENQDDQTLVFLGEEGDGTIVIDTLQDDDGVTTLHIYNIRE